VSETYDDNIDLTPTNKNSDFITTIMPSLTVAYLKEKTKLDLNYSPGLALYAEHSKQNTVRHAGTLNLDRQLAKDIKLNLNDNLLRAEDPLQDTLDEAGNRTRRRKYWRNSGEVSVSDTYGPGRDVSAGYRNFYTRSDDQRENSGTVQAGFGSVTHWFNIRNGAELTYQYTRSNLSAGDNNSNDNFVGHTPGFTLRHRFTPHSMLSGGYSLTTRNFEDKDNHDYRVHTGSVGYEQAIASDLSFSITGGYFYAAIDGDRDFDGPDYAMDFKKTFEHAAVTLSGKGGWTENYLDAQRTTFTQYHQGSVGARYQFRETVTGYVNGLYRWNKDSDNRVWKIWQAGGGLRWAFLRWFTATLQYTYRQHVDDVKADEYKDNRVMLIFTASKLYRIW
jgi:hypothetical protein